MLQDCVRDRGPNRHFLVFLLRWRSFLQNFYMTGCERGYYLLFTSFMAKEVEE